MESSLWYMHDSNRPLARATAAAAAAPLPRCPAAPLPRCRGGPQVSHPHHPPPAAAGGVCIKLQTYFRRKWERGYLLTPNHENVMLAGVLCQATGLPFSSSPP